MLHTDPLAAAKIARLKQKQKRLKKGNDLAKKAKIWTVGGDDDQEETDKEVQAEIHSDDETVDRSDGDKAHTLGSMPHLSTPLNAHDMEPEPRD